MTDRDLFALDKPLQDLAPEEIHDFLQEMAETNQVVFSGVPWREFLARFRAAFRCTQCGACCQREMSQRDQGVALGNDELEEMATLKGMAPEEFQRQYCRSGTNSMRYPCPFHIPGACSIYERRPFVCLIFPLDGEERGGQRLAGVQVVCPGGRAVMEQIMLEERTSLQRKEVTHEVHTGPLPRVRGGTQGGR